MRISEWKVGDHLNATHIRWAETLPGWRPGGTRKGRRRQASPSTILTPPLPTFTIHHPLTSPWKLIPSPTALCCAVKNTLWSNSNNHFQLIIWNTAQIWTKRKLFASHHSDHDSRIEMADLVNRKERLTSSSLPSQQAPICRGGCKSIENISSLIVPDEK